MNLSQKKQYDLTFIFFSALVCLFSYFVILLGDSILNNGWDGMKYTSMAQDFYNHVIGSKESAYYSQRIFPSAVVWNINMYIHLEPTPENIATLFQLLNIGIIVWGMHLLKLICIQLNYSPKTYLLGLIFSVVNFAVLGAGLFYPTLTDTMAYFLGMVLLYGYVFEKKNTIILATFFGAFTWPFFLFFGLACLVFPFKNKIELDKSKPTIWDKIIPITLSLPLAINAIICLLNFYYLSVSSLPGHIPAWLFPEYYMSRIALISIILNLGYLSILIFVIIPNISNIKSFVMSFFSSLKNWQTLALAISTLVGVKYLKHFLTNYDYPPTNGLDVLFRDASNLSTIKPLVIIVEAFNNYGILILLFVLFFNKISKYIPKMGGGFLIGFGFFILISLTPESRRFINFYPFLVLLIMAYFNDRGVKNYMIGVIFIVNILLMKPMIHFLTINVGDMLEWFKYPTQLYFMNTYLISNEAYIQTGLAMLVLGAILFFIFRKEDKLKLEN